MLRTTTLFIVLILLSGGCSFAVPLGPADVKTTTIDGDVLFVRIREQGFDSAVYYERAEMREHDGVVSVQFYKRFLHVDGDRNVEIPGAVIKLGDYVKEVRLANAHGGVAIWRRGDAENGQLTDR